MCKRFVKTKTTKLRSDYLGWHHFIYLSPIDLVHYIHFLLSFFFFLMSFNFHNEKEKKDQILNLIPDSSQKLVLKSLFHSFNSRLHLCWTQKQVSCFLYHTSVEHQRDQISSSRFSGNCCSRVTQSRYCPWEKGSG